MLLLLIMFADVALDITAVVADVASDDIAAVAVFVDDVC